MSANSVVYDPHHHELHLTLKAKLGYTWVHHRGVGRGTVFVAVKRAVVCTRAN